MAGLEITDKVFPNEKFWHDFYFFMIFASYRQRQENDTSAIQYTHFGKEPFTHEVVLLEGDVVYRPVEFFGW